MSTGVTRSAGLLLGGAITAGVLAGIGVERSVTGPKSQQTGWLVAAGVAGASGGVMQLLAERSLGHSSFMASKAGFAIPVLAGALLGHLLLGGGD